MGRAREEKRRKEKIREEKESEERRCRMMQVREKVAKSRSTMFFQWFVAAGGSKIRLAKAAGAEPCGQMREDKLHAIVARSTFPSQNVQSTPFSRTTFGSGDVEKSARRCGVKHISKSKV